MVSGTVSDDLEAVVSLQIVGHSGPGQTLDVVIDTGFDGELILPLAQIQALRLLWHSQIQGTLADGSSHIFDIYEATVEWHGQPRSILVGAANTAPLAGMLLLHGSTLDVDVVAGGSITIRP